MVWDARNTAFQRLQAGNFGCIGFTNLPITSCASPKKIIFLFIFGTNKLLNLTAFIQCSCGSIRLIFLVDFSSFLVQLNR